jgi:hypothetical protein
MNSSRNGVGRAHPAEICDERQKFRRAVDGETIALNGQLLRLSLCGTETKEHEYKDAHDTDNWEARETSMRANARFTCHDSRSVDPP